MLEICADTILLQFRGLAQFRLDRVSLQERKDVPEEEIAVWQAVAGGLQAVARQAAPALLDALLAWRREALGSATQLTSDPSAPPALLVHKKLAIEAIFLEMVLRVVAPGSSGLSENQISALQDLAFDWILSADRYVEAQHAELASAREKVVSACGRLIGFLSRSRLESIVARFLRELATPSESGQPARLRSDSSVARQELFQLCEGMKFVELPASNSAEVVHAANVLGRLDPLKHVAPFRKSQMQHALSDMVSSILTHNVMTGNPREGRFLIDPAAMAAWHSTVHSMRVAIGAWLSKASKHAMVAFPLLTQLLCLDSENAFMQGVAPLLDGLQKQLKGDAANLNLLQFINPLSENDKKANKDRALRSMALRCTAQLITTHLQRRSGNPADRLTALLRPHFANVLNQLRRNTFHYPEQKAMVQKLLVDVAKYAPWAAFYALVNDVLPEPSNWEATLVGLQALLTILFDGLQHSSHTGMQQQTQGRGYIGTDRTKSDEHAVELLQYVRNGGQPLDAYRSAEYTSRVAASLSKILAHCQSHYGALRQTNNSKPLSEQHPREKLVGLPVFAAALRCVPYVMPHTWLEKPALLADELCLLTIHADPMVRRTSWHAVERVLRALPALRNAVLQGMASVICRVEEDQAQVLLESCRRLLRLAVQWSAFLKEESLDVVNDKAAALTLDLSRLEGCGLCLLCHHNMEVRSTALDLLGALRTLHRALLDVGGGMAARLPAPSSAGDTGATTPTSLLDAGAMFDMPTYLMDVVEQMGDDVARRCYWDWGPWSDLTRLWRPVDIPKQHGTYVTFKLLMAQTSSTEHMVRWAVCLNELLQHACLLCLPSVIAASSDVSNRLQSSLVRDSSQRMIMPAEGAADVARLHAARTYCLMLVGCPPRVGGVRAGGINTKDVMRILVNTLRNGGEAQQCAAVLALSRCNPGAHPFLLEELQSLADDYGSDRGKGAKSRLKQVELRTLVAHVYRCFADGLRPGSLRSDAQLRSRVLDFIADTLKHLASPSLELSMEVQQLRHCLAVVTNVTAVELAVLSSTLFAPSLKRQLWRTLAPWSQEASPDAKPGSYRAELRRGIMAAKARLKDVDAQRILEAELVDSVELLEHSANNALAALFLGTSFDIEARRPFIDRLLSSRASRMRHDGSPGTMGPLKSAVARRALMYLMQSNLDLLDSCIDHCYASDPVVARAHFKVLAELYSSAEISIKPHIVVALVLHKVVDPLQEVRDDALQMLSMLAERCWQTGAADSQAYATGQKNGLLLPGSLDPDTGRTVMGNLQESFHNFQLRLSVKLARDHPELTELLSVELMTRQLDIQSTAAILQQHAMLASLVPWMENISFAARWEGNWSERLLKSLYYVTWRHGDQLPQEIEALWRTVASNKRNIIPVLDFLFARGLQECASQSSPQDLESLEVLTAYFAVAKRISLYLARPSPHATIDHLVHEVSLMMTDDSEGSASYAAALPLPGSSGFVEDVQWPAEAAVIDERLKMKPYGQPGSMSRASSLSARHLASDSLSSEASGLSSHAQREPAGAVISEGASLVRQQPADPSLWGRTGAGHVASIQRGVLTRPELAMCLAAEVVYELDEEVRGHCAALAHAALLGTASAEPLVARHALQLLIHLLHSLSARHCALHRISGGMLEESVQVSSLTAHLQSLRGQQLWVTESAAGGAGAAAVDGGSLPTLVNAIVAAMFFQSDLRARWAAEALQWLLESSNAQHVTLSHQIYRAVRPELGPDAAGTLLGGLSRCLETGSPASLASASQLVVTLQALVLATNAEKLMLYPHVLLSCLVLLPLPSTELFTHALPLLLTLVSRMDLTDTTTQSVLLAAASGSQPSTEGGPLVGAWGSAAVGSGWLLGRLLLGPGLLAGVQPPLVLQQLLLKGLLLPSAELLTVQVLVKLAAQLSTVLSESPEGVASTWSVACAARTSGGRHGFTALLGPVKCQLAITLLSLLPWIITHCLDTRPPLDVISTSEAGYHHRSESSGSSKCAEETHRTLQSAIAALAGCCISQKLEALASALLGLVIGCTGGSGAEWEASLELSLRRLAAPLVAAFFPKYAPLAMLSFMGVLRAGPPAAAGPTLRLLRYILEVPGINLGPTDAYPPQPFAPLASLLDGRHSAAALQVLEAMMRCKDSQPPNEVAGVGTADSTEGTLLWSMNRTLDPGSNFANAALAALGRLAQACPRAPHRAPLLPRRPHGPLDF